MGRPTNSAQSQHPLLCVQALSLSSCGDGTGTTATNPYGGAITLVPASLNGTNDSVQVTWPNVLKDQCSDIVTNIEREMRQVSVGSTVVKDGGGPMDIEALETACDAATAVTIDFWVGRS